MANSMGERIALITLDYPPETGGVARYLGSLVHHAGGAIDVFINLTHASVGPGRVEPVELLHTGRWSWRPAISFIKSLHRRGYSHVLVSHALPLGTAAWMANRLGGLPYSVILHGLDLRLALGRKRKVWLLRRVLRGARNVIANSEFVANEIRSFDPTLNPKVLTPATEPVNRLDREHARRLLDIPSDAPLVLAVSRLVGRKGHDVLMQAVRSLPNVHLTIVGSGSELAKLEGLARTIGKRVRIVSSADDESRDLWYAAADVFSLLPRDEGDDVEGFGIVFLEAAMHGLPSVAGASGGVPEAVRDGKDGFLVDPVDPQAVAAALKRLFADPTLRIEMGRAARTRVLADFRWEDRVTSLLGFLGPGFPPARE